MIFELRKEAQELLDRVKDFMEKEIYPSEQTYSNQVEEVEDGVYHLS